MVTTRQTLIQMIQKNDQAEPDAVASMLLIMAVKPELTERMINMVTQVDLESHNPPEKVTDDMFVQHILDGCMSYGFSKIMELCLVRIQDSKKSEGKVE